MQHKKHKTEDFDSKAREWDTDPDKLERAKKFARQIETKILDHNQITRAMEFGCGTAEVSFNLRHRLKKAELVDTSEGMLKVAQEKIKKYNATQFTTHAINLLDDELKIEKINLIYSLLSLHHIIDLNKILKRLNSMLETKGFLCIGDLEPEDGSFHKFSEDFNGHLGFERNELADKMNKAGFKETDYHVFYQLNRETVDQKGNPQIRNYPLFFAVYQKN